MDIKKTIIVTALVMIVMTMFSVDSDAQIVSIKVGTGDNDIVLVNANSGVMWCVDFKGLSFSFRNSC